MNNKLLIFIFLGVIFCVFWIGRREGIKSKKIEEIDSDEDFI